MKNTILSLAAVFSFAGAAFAQEAATGAVISGEVGVDFAETSNNNYGGSMDLELNVDAAGLGTVDLDFSAVDGGSVTLDNWTVGTNLGGLGIALGDDNGLMPEAEGEQTLAAPAMAESVKLTYGDAAVAIGFTDWSVDVTDISNVQGAYTLDVAGVALTASADHNFDADNTVLGAELAGIEAGAFGLGGAATYDMDAELFGFEGVVTAGGLTAYANGDENDTLQNVGAEYAYDLNGAELTAGFNYDTDAEDFAPTAGIAFKF